jgi:2-polyprenyl-6-hydroxyphenyl methylase/3-demethylubiquinone-9 3-methyltransferase
MTDKITFSFGHNWQEFIDKHFTQERVETAKQHLLKFLGVESLNGLTFVDVGCGSGLMSLAALEAGATRVVSFDIDPKSVSTTKHIRELRGNSDNWEILQGSALDQSFLASLDKADIVYSWGVLHHTGSMWEAVRNTATLMKPQSIFYLGLYTTTSLSKFWLKVKKRYNRASPFLKNVMVLAYFLLLDVLPHPFTFMRKIRNYKKTRGMDQFTDIRDWLGGYPYEDAKPEEVLRFCHAQLGLELTDMTTGEAVTEYLFKSH